jgi:hypothetical protein
VSATPTAFINGVMLDNIPQTVEEWMTVLTEVKDSQHKRAQKFLQLCSQ